MKTKFSIRVIPQTQGSLSLAIVKNSDLSASLGFVEAKLKDLLLSSQKPGDPAEW